MSYYQRFSLASKYYAQGVRECVRIPTSNWQILLLFELEMNLSGRIFLNIVREISFTKMPYHRLMPH